MDKYGDKMISQNLISEKDNLREITPTEAYYTDTRVLYVQTSKRAIYKVLGYYEKEVVVLVGTLPHVKDLDMTDIKKTYLIDKVKFMI